MTTQEALDQWNALAAEYDDLCAQFRQRPHRAKTARAMDRAVREANEHRRQLLDLASRDRENGNYVVLGRPFQMPPITAEQIEDALKRHAAALRPYVRRAAQALDRDVPLGV
jgi:hypothetical protein